LAGCTDARDVLAPEEPSAVISTPPAEEEIPPELATRVNLWVVGQAGFSDTYGWMWAVATAYATRLRLEVKAVLNGTSEGEAVVRVGKNYLLPLPAHSLNATARAAVQNSCGATVNGSAFARAYNEAILSKGWAYEFGEEQITAGSVGAQPPCEDTAEEATVQPTGGSGGSNGDGGDCELWGYFVNGILIFTFEVGADC
jgi:hypothetical protein